MSRMGRYCKAYPISQLRRFNQWTERSENSRKEKKAVDGVEVKIARQLGENDFLYLQENYIVTDGIFLDENIIFDDVNPEWEDFCRNTLKFKIPAYEFVEGSESIKVDNPADSNSR